MRQLKLTIPSLLLPLLAACSGGSQELQAAALRGLVFEIDDQTVDRSGVDFRVAETGDQSTTGQSGSFAFTGIPTGTITLLVGPDAPVIEDVEPGDRVEVRLAMSNGRIAEFSVTGHGGDDDRRRAEASLTRHPNSPDADAEGDVKIETRDDREKFTAEAENLPAGTVVEFFLDDPGDALGFVAIVPKATADASGEAELELNTKDGDTLPFGVTAVEDLSGFAIEARMMSSGAVLLTGTVPDLPDGMPADDDGNPAPGARARGKDKLAATAAGAGLQGNIDIRAPEQRFKMEAEKLVSNTAVAFEMKNDAGSFVRIGAATADSVGEAEISTQDGLPMPLGVSDVADLVGRDVRVILDDGSNTVLLTGTVPALVAD